MTKKARRCRVLLSLKGGIMNLIRREPNVTLFTLFEQLFIRVMEEMSDRLGKLFGTWTRPFEIKESLKVADFTPAVDIQETEKEYLLKVEIPEVKKEDVSVVVQESVLTITGETKIAAEYKDGLLQLHLPKLARPLPKTIEVKVF